MRRRRGALAAGLPMLAAALMISMSAAAPALAEPPSTGGTGGTAGSAAAPAGPSRLITLITGDQVLVGAGEPGQESITMVASPGGQSDAVQIRRDADHTVVVPDAAAPYLRSGLLDPALFDVTALIAQGLDDTARDTLPLIVQHADPGARGPATTLDAAAAALGEAAGDAEPQVLTSIAATAVDQDKAHAAALWDHLVGASAATARAAAPVERVWLDRTVRASLDESTAQIGAPAAWELGLTGDGATIAVLDTGVDATHPDLADRVILEKNFSEADDVVDRAGHGTHVASIAAGTGAASDGSYRGVAAGAEVLSGKALDDYGSGYTSDIIAGMEWAVANGADVVNLSLGSGPSDGTDPGSQAIDRLTTESGVLFVVAAGNGGEQDEAVSAPAAADHALAVAAVDATDTVADFSSRGPRELDGAIKPEIAAPGVDITAARADGTGGGGQSTGDAADEPAGDGDPGEGPYIDNSGTSMAAPHVAGAAAVLAGQHPDWAAPQLRAALMSTAAVSTDVSIYDGGAGRVDLAAATTATVLPSVGEIELGYLDWPHDGQQPVAGDVTYTNSTDADVTLTLDLAARAGDTPVPGDALTLDGTELVVPANGTATTTVTLDPDGLPFGHYEGRLTATGAGTEQTTAVAVGWYVEPEMYDVTVRGINRDGSPAAADLDVIDVGHGTREIETLDGETTLRLAPGTYSFGSVLNLTATDDARASSTLVIDPEIEVSGDTTVTLDAREGQPVQTEVSGVRGATPRWVVMGYSRTPAEGDQPFVASLETSTPAVDLYATPTGDVSTGALAFDAGARLEAAPVTARVRGRSLDVPTAYYTFSERFDGRMTMPVADAGDATPEDLADLDLDGALALIRLDPALAPGEQAAAAAAAGASGVLFYDADRGGLRTSMLYPLVSIPVIGTSRAAAQELIERLGRGAVNLTLTAVAQSPYVYDIVQPVEGGVPDEPQWRYRKRDFAQLDVTFGGHQPTDRLGETRSAVSPTGVESGGWMLPDLSAPSTRTDHVLAGDVRWRQFVIQHNADDSSPGWSELPRTYEPGQRTDVGWMRPVLAQTLPAGESTHLVERLGDEMVVGLGGFVDAPDREQSWGSWTESYEMRLFHGDELVGTSADRYGWFEVPAGPGEYRLELDGSFEQPWWEFSTSVSSAWTFGSAGGGDGDAPERLPLVLADIDVPAADATGRVPAGKPAVVEVGIRHQHGSTGGDVAAVTLEASLDGGSTWTEVELNGDDGSYAGEVESAPGDAGGAVTLRVTADDSDGNGIEQTITRAFGLRE